MLIHVIISHTMSILHIKCSFLLIQKMAVAYLTVDDTAVHSLLSSSENSFQFP